MKCRYCGYDLIPGAICCPQCKNAVSASSQFPVKKRRIPLIVEIVGGVVVGLVMLCIILSLLNRNKYDSNSSISDRSSYATTQDTDSLQQISKEQIIYEKNGIKIVCMGFDNTGALPKFMFKIENRSNYNICVDSDNVSVNDYMISTALLSKVAAGKTAIDNMTMFKNSLDECGIKTVEKLEFILKIREANNYGESPINDSINVSIVF